MGGVNKKYPMIYPVQYIIDNLNSVSRNIVGLCCLYMNKYYEAKDLQIVGILESNGISIETINTTLELYQNENYQCALNVNNEGYIFNPCELAGAIVSDRKFCYLSLSKNTGIYYNLPSMVLENYKKKIDSVFVKSGLYFFVILWGAVSDYFRQIISDIKSTKRVVYSRICNNASNYYEIIEELYSLDNVEKWKINIKKAYLKDYPSNICVVIFDNQKPEFRINLRTGLYISQSAIELKKDIRTKYKAMLHSYADDIIIHIGDNYDSNRQLLNILCKYKVIDQEYEEIS